MKHFSDNGVVLVLEGQERCLSIVYLYRCTCVCRSTRVCRSRCTWRKEVNSDVFFNHFSSLIFFLSHSLSLNLEIDNSTRLASPCIQTYSCLGNPSTVVAAHTVLTVHWLLSLSSFLDLEDYDPYSFACILENSSLHLLLHSRGPPN